MRQPPATLDMHVHVVPRSLPERIRARSATLPSVALSETPDGRPLIGLPRSAALGPARPPIPLLLDMAAQVTRMDQQGIDLAIISIWPDLLGTDLPPDESAAWAEIVNDGLVEAAATHDRLLPMACVPVQSDAAAAEMKRAKSLGCVGVEIGTRALQHELDSEQMEPVWRAAAELQMPVFVHPLYYGGDTRLADSRAYGLANSIGRVNDTTIAISRLLLAGTLLKYPGLEIIVAHGGGAIPYLLGRLGTVHKLDPQTADPEAGFRRLHFDTIVFDPATLAFLIEKAGPEHVMLASDYPFDNGDPEPTKVVLGAGLSQEVQDLVMGANARRVYRL